MNENPKADGLLIVLGVIPIIALTDSVINTFAIGFTTLIVLIFSSIFFAFEKKYINESNSFIVLIIITATITTISDHLLQIHLPAIRSDINIFLPLITVNSFVLYYIKKYKYPNSVLKFTFYGIKKCLVIFLVIFVIGLCREILGKGTLFNLHVLTSDLEAKPIIIVDSPPGAFIMTAIVLILFNIIKNKNR